MAKPTPESSDESQTATPSPTEPAAQPPLTARTSKEFAAVLALKDYCSQDIADFADKYSGRRIAFDGSIVAMNNHESYNTRYDILINAGDFSETVSIPGPAFQFRDVNTTSDLKYSGSDVPDSIGVGTNLRVVAEVVKYEPNSCLFLLDPVSTEFR